MFGRQRLHAPRIVQPGNRGGSWWWLLLVVLAGLLAWQAFDYGRKRAGYDSEVCASQLLELEVRVVKLERERERFRREAARFERSAQIDQTAVHSVQGDLKALQNERSQLRQEVEFLKSMVSGDAKAVQLTEFQLTDLKKERKFRFSFTVSKRGGDKQRLRGHATVSLVGLSKGEERVLDGDKLGVAKKDLVLGFMNFQKIEGELSLPEGFVPAELKIGIKPDDSTFKALELTFPWKTESS
jgi:hypothetical protein